MIPAGFVQFLVDDMTAEGSTEWVDDLLAAAKAQIVAGAGSLPFVIGASLNGKSFNFDARTSISSAEMAIACRQALQSYKGKAAGFTYGRFDRIER